ncbi:tRNA (guanine-N7-)-methyltransferase [Aequitasia blattaphilus]|uniref:tRNA (guanine-N(7)-)-methyltransferase n=1 Tax=Aequitasia blattaphilus TaxID=2949332 RepID=A0ABT1E4S0_9FIRM|nr:tRNA (guanosine(46)-N7)-methyltransferase TrmB [Aequitasia blattaphilus]MCP1100830.1 tRNA (guanosine(46)-N7)-methyltransferase TrmB [Aequitasia blattaphilus]MCR8613470.1 tRNA (guanosine(46)-N7)-methyltransferase TrmB [Aequitasia blattaphilus]
MRLRNIPRADEVLKENENVVNNPQKRKGKWKKEFGNENPIEVEIGMGKGRFILTHASKNPDKNYIGIERYSSVLLRGVESIEEYVENLRLLCQNAVELEELFEKEEIDRIYLNFSDPWPKKRHARRRLTSREFLKRYYCILREEGELEFKTDNRDLFEFSLEEIKESKEFELLEHTFDLHNNEEMNQGNVMTEYEEKFSAKGNPIHKLIARKTALK